MLNKESWMIEVILRLYWFFKDNEVYIKIYRIKFIFRIKNEYLFFLLNNILKFFKLYLKIFNRFYG